MRPPDYFRLICLTAALCAYTPAILAEEVKAEPARAAETKPEEASKAELEFEADPYYTNVGYNVPLTVKPIPTISSDSEAKIYRDLIEGSLIPRYMVLEASVNPLPWLGTYIKSHSPTFFKQGELGHSGINLIESATAGFPEPWAVSAFFGNVAKLQRPNEKRHGNNYGYTGYLVSAGNKHIKNNTLIHDDWYEIEWKIKGKIDYPDERLSWSFRVGGRINQKQGRQQRHLREPASQQPGFPVFLPGMAGERQLRYAHCFPAKRRADGAAGADRGKEDTDARMALHTDAGHWFHLEQPERILRRAEGSAGKHDYTGVPAFARILVPPCRYMAK